MWRTVVISIFLFSALIHNSIAQPVIVVKQDKAVINIGRQMAVLPDTLNKLSFSDILNGPASNRFSISRQQIPNFGSSTFPVWCRFRLRNTTDQKLVLFINNSELEWVDLYIIKNNSYEHKSISAYYPFVHRDVLVNKDLFLLDIPKNSMQTYYLRLQTNTGLQFPLTIATLQSLVETQHPLSLLYGIYIGIMLIMMLYNLFIYFSTTDRSYLFYVLYVAFMTLTNLIEKGIAFEFLWPSFPVLNHYVNIAACFTGIFAVLFSISFLHINQYSRIIRTLFNGIIFLYLISIIVILFQQRFIGMVMTESVSILATLTLLTAGIVAYNRGYKPAIYYLIAWTFLLIGVIVFILKDYGLVPFTTFNVNSMTIGSAVEALLLSLALANRINTYKKEKEKAQQDAMRSLEEKRKLIAEQNAILEGRVEERTLMLKQTNKELITTLQNLKETQAQLVQREKMASLGELTAGIAHEIQNPLNFVNNFSDVSVDLASELKGEIDKASIPPADKQNMVAIADDLIQNQQKINHHGKRADAIVKGMLQHSRMNTGQKELTDINALVDEYLRLSYHGLRAKDKIFNATLQTDYDKNMDKINVIPQDIGRVLLNLFNNAFYAVSEKKKELNGSYEPTVFVRTEKLDNEVRICVRDNGPGIPEKIINKLFQPFFTTKPTGAGTGLGLSLSYDIIKAHNGTIKIETKEGEGSEFIIQLPQA